MQTAEFSRTYEPAKVEPHWYARWLEADAFAPRPRPENGPDVSPYVVLLPPPNVTGVLHMGHILSSTIQDVFVRFQRMRGRETLWWPGTDHAGIATQKVVEKSLRDRGIDPQNLSREEFLRHCWEWKERSHAHITAQMKRVGWSLDWSREYFTLDEHMSRAVVEVFIRLYDKGLIYRGEYITNWCPTCRTALSDEEVEHVEVEGTLWTVAYPRVDGQGVVEVSTTRPETILGDTAVAIHPEDPRAAELVGKTVRLPVIGREIPILADAYVDPEFGTGMVKITPAHDPNDFEVGKRHGLEMPIVIDAAGRMNDAAGPFAGQDRFAAREALLEHLRDHGQLVKEEPHTLAQGRHDRCGTVIEPWLSKQWFVRMQPLAAPAISAVEDGRIRFFPERWRNVYLHWMRNIQDWCISRQLQWGHRIPIYTCSACGNEQAAHASPAACSACGHGELAQDPDVLDTWFSSWLVPFSPMGWPEDTEDLRRYHPTTMLVTGPDIIFFWVARMIMASLEFAGDIPFSQVLLNGILRDGKGRKMSKSLGNSPEPLDLIERYGADALRFSTIMLSPPGQDTFFDEKNVETGRNFANKIWNAARFVLQSRSSEAAEATGSTLPPGQAAALQHRAARLFGAGAARIDPSGLCLEDRWILHSWDAACAETNAAMNGLRANEAASHLYHFFWDSYCAWYLESIKPRLRGEAGASRLAAETVAFVLLAEFTELLSPFMPHLAEELWSRIPGTEGLVMLQPYPQPDAALRDPAAAATFAWVMEAAGALRTLRSEMNVPPGRRARAWLAPGGSQTADLDGEASALLRLHAKLESLEPAPSGGRPAGSASVVVRDDVFYVPLGELVDLEVEATRLRKGLEKIEGDLAGVRKKLENPQFVDRAPAHVVAFERQRLADLEARRARLQTTLAEISGKD